MKKRIGVLLINLGSPDDAKPFAVYRYLTEFLNDPRVIDLPTLGRFLLVNFIIVPFRFLNSTKLYKQLWTPEGSPLINYGKQLRSLVQNEFPESDTKIYLAMRYGNPSLDDILKEMEKEHFHKLIILPLFPQYASATNGSAIEKSLRLIKNWYVIPEIKVISQFYDHPDYINTFVKIGAGYKPETYDHILFSYHGLPLRQLDKVYEDRNCGNHSCEHEINDQNLYCYKATCYATTRMIAKGLGIPENKYTVCFQSRLSNKWMEPFADAMVIEQAKKGAKKLLVFSPAFVSDCLETNIEIGHEYHELFVEHGGEHLQLVESLNIHPDWVNGIRNLIAHELPS